MTIFETSLAIESFDIDAGAARLEWYRWLGNYKIFALITSIVPYIALRLAG